MMRSGHCFFFPFELHGAYLVSLVQTELEFLLQVAAGAVTAAGMQLICANSVSPLLL